MRKNKKAGGGAVALAANNNAATSAPISVVVQGQDLDSFLSLIRSAIERAKQLDKGYCLPPKLWLKQQFSIGVNEVTRTLERMPPTTSSSSSLIIKNHNSLKPNLHLQAVVVAADCNPKWMTKHLHSLASSRNVPLILVKDQKNKNNNENKAAAAASLKLGQLVNLKTAIAIGIKSKGNAINQIMDEFFHSKDVNLEKRLLVHQETS